MLFRSLFSDFADSFGDADELYLIPLYAVRGRDDGDGKSSKQLAELIKQPQAKYAPTFDKAYEQVMQGFDVQKHIVVFMGVGDIDEQLRAKL